MLKNRLFLPKVILASALLILAGFLFSGKNSTVYAQSAFPGSYQYTVASGDTLYAIAAQNGISLDVLRAVNGISGSMIYPGQVLNIPGNTGKIFTRYTIVPGDNLYAISGKFGVAVGSIMAANNISSTMIISGQSLVIPYLPQKPLSSILSSYGISPSNPGISIIVDKSEHTLMLFSRGRWLKTYHVELGSGGLGDKQVRDDFKTPEGSFYICEDFKLNPEDKYLGTRWLRLSYPNTDDAARGLNAGLINLATFNAIKTAINSGKIPPQDTALGAGVGIHGGSSPSAGIDWTWGCIGLTSRDVEELFTYTGIGSRVYVQK